MGSPKTLLLIPSVAKRGIDADVAANQHPTMDYYALQAKLQGDLADYATVEADRHPLVRAARLLGRDVGLAMYGALRASQYDVIFSNGENVSIPLAAFLKLHRRRAAHVTIGHRLSAAKKKIPMRLLQSEMDAVFVYAEPQRAYAQDVLGIPASRLHLIPFHADSHFYAPRPAPIGPARICSAGLELRDYPTLIDAVRDLDVEVRLAAASPWSKRANETEDRSLPAHVSARGYSYRELRDLYASSRFVVVALYETDFQAGVTTILEAMAMGKAVIVSRTAGQRDVIQDGVNGIYVPPGDVRALRQAIVGLLASPQRAAELGANARRTIEREMSLDLWVERIATVVEHLKARR